MNKRDSTPDSAAHSRTDRLDPPRGLLGLPDRLPFTVRRFFPATRYTWCIEHFWVSSWDLPGRGAIVRILPSPAVNLTLESEGLVLTGVAPGVWSRRLRGTTAVFGVKFTPGAFRLLTDVSIRSISGAGQPADSILPGCSELAAALSAAGDDHQRAVVIEDHLDGLGIHDDPTLALIRSAVALLTADPSIHRVTQVGDWLGISERSLQRLFGDYVGVTPGWVLRRGRLHAAAERVIQLAGGATAEGLAGIAAEFGYADQAHFTRDFRRVLGVAPGSWAANLITEEPAD